MNSATAQRSFSRRSICQSKREWVQLALATAAGAALIWQCLRPDSDMSKCGLLLFLCLTFFGRRTLLRQFLSVLKPYLSAATRK
jgi:hypothetical protein